MIIRCEYDAKQFFTESEWDNLKDHIMAFIHNASYLRIEREDCGNGFYVFANESRDDSYTQYCIDESYLDGWLYGVVQAMNKHIPELPIDFYEMERQVEEIVKEKGCYREKAIIEVPHFYRIATWNKDYKCVNVYTEVPDEDGYRDRMTVDLKAKLIRG